MADEVTRLESRVARIEGEVTQLNLRLAGLETDLRDLRGAVDRALDKFDAKLEARFERLVAKIDRLGGKQLADFEKLEAKIQQQTSC